MQWPHLLLYHSRPSDRYLLALVPGASRVPGHGVTLALTHDLALVVALGGRTTLPAEPVFHGPPLRIRVTDFDAVDLDVVLGHYALLGPCESEQPCYLRSGGWS